MPHLCDWSSYRPDHLPRGGGGGGGEGALPRQGAASRLHVLLCPSSQEALPSEQMHFSSFPGLSSAHSSCCLPWVVPSDRFSGTPLGKTFLSIDTHMCLYMYKLCTHSTLRIGSVHSENTCTLHRNFKRMR